jgi:hypothetical protein
MNMYLCRGKHAYVIKKVKINHMILSISLALFYLKIIIWTIEPKLIKESKIFLHNTLLIFIFIVSIL